MSATKSQIVHPESYELINRMLSQIVRSRRSFTETLSPTTSEGHYWKRLVGSRDERNFYFRKFDEYGNRAHDLRNISSKKEQKKAVKELFEEWTAFERNTVHPFLMERTFRDVSIDSDLCRELLGELAPYKVPPITPQTVPDSVSTYSFPAPTLEFDRLTIGSTAGPSTPSVAPSELPLFEGEDPDHFVSQATVVGSDYAAKAFKAAKKMLINIDGEDRIQQVAIRDLLTASGAYGEVYRGDYIIKEGERFEYICAVVAKRSKKGGTVTTEDRKLLRRRMGREAKVASHLNHPAITTYIGLFVDERSLSDELADYYLVSDFVNGGLAREYLATNRSPEVAEKLFRDLMSGLTYMHTEQTEGDYHKGMICHGDLKGTNYLVELETNEKDRNKPKITGKITDFGLSSILGSKYKTPNSQVSNAYRWRAPELAKVDEDDVEGREKYLEKADVWSFALTSLEIVKNEEPFLNYPNFIKFFRIWDRNPELLVDSLPEDNPVEDLLSFHAFEVMKLCWKLDPAQRPRMIQALRRYEESSRGVLGDHKSS